MLCLSAMVFSLYTNDLLVTLGQKLIYPDDIVTQAQYFSEPTTNSLTAYMARVVH